MSAMPGMFVFVFVAIFAAAMSIFVFTLVRGIRMWAANNAQPVRQELAEVVAKRSEVSGGENSTSTAYHATFELPDRTRTELRISGREYGQLAEGDRGQLTHQGTRFLGFVRQRTSVETPTSTAPPLPAQRMCAYCGNALASGAVKCATCGWTWRPVPAENDQAQT